MWVVKLLNIIKLIFTSPLFSPIACYKACIQLQRWSYGFEPAVEESAAIVSQGYKSAHMPYHWLGTQSVVWKTGLSGQPKQDGREKKKKRKKTLAMCCQCCQRKKTCVCEKCGDRWLLDIWSRLGWRLDVFIGLHSMALSECMCYFCTESLSICWGLGSGLLRP